MVHIEQRLLTSAPIQRCFDLARSIEVHLLGTESSGEQAISGVTTGLIGFGEFVEWRAKHLGITQRLTSKITAFESPVYFQDTMIAGVFSFMQHDHLFASIAPDLTEMTDHFVFRAPLSILGIAAERLFLRRYMGEFLRRRNQILKEVAESDGWSEFIPQARHANPRPI